MAHTANQAYGHNAFRAAAKKFSFLTYNSHDYELTYPKTLLTSESEKERWFSPIVVTRALERPAEDSHSSMGNILSSLTRIQ